MSYFEQYIKGALQRFYQNDDYLIEHDVHEQTMSARIAHYLISRIEEKRREGEEEFEEIKIDCEYNKSMGAPKRRACRDRNSDRPDIIAHKRGINTNNKFVIEMKKGKSECDKCRIKDFVDDYTLKYEEGYAIQEIKKDSFHIFFYQRGDSEVQELRFKVTDDGEIEPV